MSGKRSISGRIKPLILILFFLIFSLGAEELTEAERNFPVWVLMEKGKAAFRAGDFATAHTFFSYSRIKGAVLPEAEYWMGRVFEEEGELSLAISQYQKALELSRYLYIGDDQIDISYRLADSFKKMGNWDMYEFQLQILVDEEIVRNQEILDREHLYAVTLKEKGLDELLYLYRLDYSYSLRAFRELGVFYYKQGRFRSSTIYNLYSVMTFFSLGIKELIKEDPEFQFPRNQEKLKEYNKARYYDDIERSLRLFDPDFSFIRKKESRDLIDEEIQEENALVQIASYGNPYYYSGVGYVLDLFRENEALQPFMANHNIYQSLYYLACSLYAEGYEDSSRQIWSLLARDPQGGSWSLSAIDQLSSPHIDKSSSIF